MSIFWQLFRESVILQGLLTLMFAGTVIYLVIAGKTVPGEIYGFLGTVVGFWFGTKAQAAINAARNAAAEPPA